MTDPVTAHNRLAAQIVAMDMQSMVAWKRGLPPGTYYDGMTDDFEVYLSPGGAKWHRRRSAEDAANHKRLAAEIAALQAPVEEDA